MDGIGPSSRARYDTWVIREEHAYGPTIRRYLQTHGPIPGLRFHFLPLKPWPVRPWARKLAGTAPGWYLIYHWWQRRAWRAAARLHQQSALIWSIN